LDLDRTQKIKTKQTPLLEKAQEDSGAHSHPRTYNEKMQRLDSTETKNKNNAVFDGFGSH